MKFLVDLILLVTALGSVFYVAGLAEVPKRVRFSVLAIGPSFMLTFLLHLSWERHLDYGLSAIGLSIIASTVFGFHFTNTAPLTKEVRTQLIKRFAVIFALSAISVAIVTALIVRLDRQPAEPAKQTTSTISSTVTIADSTQQAISEFNRLGKHEK
ncbi:hypothetical protein GO755_30330 [Spirosoma sp. HMF4905]|uniref:DUF1616 domain-containing protein n=1 Tax=Spirosoma arboris TaxID=2682092 RepID=A0A7K1SKT6_9BACT|nr:hypothetical protein [Spirosoma arboris]MVM34368.1 hypothetical protein [Spirosoma arboris]